MTFDDYMLRLGNSSDPISHIWESVKDLRYAIFDTRTQREHKNPTEEDYQYMRIRTPQEVLIDKYGTCWDQTMLIAYLAQEAGLKYRVLFETCTNCNSHVICVIEYKNKYWYLETAWIQNKGKYGPYRSYDEAYVAYGQMFRAKMKGSFLYWVDGIDYEELFENKKLDMWTFYEHFGLTEKQVNYLQDPSSTLFQGMKKVETDRYNRVIKIIYSDKIIKWNPHLVSRS